jgi:AcrR family transcriptional regulator
MNTARKPSARTQATRAKLIATAEELFAAQGVASVSLNEITRAAEQKNRNAVHYHFGDKDSLILAIFEKHAGPIAAMRSVMLEEISADANATLADVVTALVQPVAARFEDADGGVAYIKISAQLAAANLLRYFHNRAGKEISPEYWPDMAKLWGPYLKDTPKAVLDQRMSLMVGMMFHGLADHAVFRDSDEADLANTALMVNNLIDSICAMLTAPVSAKTAQVLNSK